MLQYISHIPSSLFFYTASKRKKNAPPLPNYRYSSSANNINYYSSSSGQQKRCFWIGTELHTSAVRSFFLLLKTFVSAGCVRYIDCTYVVQRVLVGYTWYSFFGKTLKLALYEEKLVNLLVYWQNIEEVGTARRKGREFPSTIDGQKWAAMYVTIHTGMW